MRVPGESGNVRGCMCCPSISARHTSRTSLLQIADTCTCRRAKSGSRMEPEVDEDKLMQMNLKTAGTRALKVVATIGVAGALALAVATPGQARNGRIAAAGAGFAAGAVVGAVAANSAYG